LPKLYEAVARQWDIGNYLCTIEGSCNIRFMDCPKGAGVVKKLWIWNLSKYWMREWIRCTCALSGSKGNRQCLDITNIAFIVLYTYT
jgi:hypothetical protein